MEEIQETETMHSEVSLLIGILLTLICRMEYSILFNWTSQFVI